VTIARPAAAIIGVGATPHGEHPGRSVADLVAEATRSALADAVIDKTQVDGLVTCKSQLSGEGTDEEIGLALGLNPSFSATLDYGSSGFSLHLAAMAIANGLANCVLLTFGTTQRSARGAFSRAIGGGGDWAANHGFLHVAGPAAMAFRRHAHRFGTTERQLGHVAVAHRQWAELNPDALFRTPLSIDDYLDQQYFVEPLRRADLTVVTDGAVAIVVSSTDRAREHGDRGVSISAIAEHTFLRRDDNPDLYERPWLTSLADDLYARAQITPSDVDLAYLQEATSVWVLQLLEAFRLCPPGESGPFVAAGSIGPGGAVPVNTHGGQLSESYTWGWMHLVEAVRQLRGDCGPRQVAGAHTAIHCSTHDFFKGAATVLTRGVA
jgi:acetyl-CoA acetyltransferase